MKLWSGQVSPKGYSGPCGFGFREWRGCKVRARFPAKLALGPGACIKGIYEGAYRVSMRVLEGFFMGSSLKQGPRAQMHHLLRAPHRIRAVPSRSQLRGRLRYNLYRP